MSKSKSNLRGPTKLRPPTNLVSPVTSSTEKTSKPSRFTDARALPVGNTGKSASIKFGSPSSRTNPVQQSGSEWTNLLKQTASGGIASALSGGLGGIGGLGLLISGIVGFFSGGKRTPPPLVEFQLPASVDQTVYLSRGRSSVYQGNVTETANASNANGGIYTGGTQKSESGASGQSLQYQSAQIAAAVKNALLNSSSLNDVIAEI